MKHSSRISGRVVFQGCYDGRNCIFINDKGLGGDRIGVVHAKTIELDLLKSKPV